MELLDIQLDVELENYLAELVSTIPYEDMIPVLIAPSAVMGDMGSAYVVNVGLYPKGEENWRYALSLPSGFIRLSAPLADELSRGKQLSLEKINDAKGVQKEQLCLR